MTWSFGHRDAFSLVEVVLALAVFSFCLVSLLGLFSVGLVDSRKSSDTTIIASMASQVVNDLKSQEGLTAPGSTNYYFNFAGEETNAPSYYACEVTFNHAAGTSDSTLVVASLAFLWPSTAAAAPHTNIVYATLPPPEF